MATVVLQTVGAAIGGAIAGPVGAMVGRAAGAAAGYAIDQSLLSKDQVITGPRLDAANVLSSNEGVAIPQIYGRNRLSGEIIWATRFEEQTRKSESGGKGGSPTSTTKSYTYSANFAVGICEGPISCLRRVWADGEELDLSKIEYRFYDGKLDQSPDPLIEAKQGVGNTPAYRGVSYIVFEGLSLEQYGNRIPQLSFEVIRAVGALERDIRTITVIPGSTEYGYDPELVDTGGGDSGYETRNRHVSIADTDWDASIDELQALCPNLERVALVISWFGTDLRAAECKLFPGVTDRVHTNWKVAGYQRHNAHLVSQVDGKPAFGGTPDDASVERAIADLKSRGLEVVLYPFLMMDIPAENERPSLLGMGFQPAYPWRGQISCFPAIGVAGSVDQTHHARTQIEAFSEQYQTFIQHYLSLAQRVGGVNGFLVGSELKALTRIRDHNGKFPFVETLTSIAELVKASLGDDCLVTYAADWSEYFGYQPQDGSGDVLYNLDTLWASESIDAIGIDNYMPLSDWRNGQDSHDHDVHSPHDIEYLQSNISAGEGYDWYYASNEDRANGVRNPITDGSGEPWIYRYKDLVSWWENSHYERISGVKADHATNWVPGSKPIIFTELGCPAVDHGANQPNVFFDPKSSQSQLPYFSSGGRDDLIQRRFLEAHYMHWKKTANNPTDSVSGVQMVSTDWIAPWAWDARPFPTFPQSVEVWSDGENWNRGHWLTGRLGGCPLNDLVKTILSDFGQTNIIIKLDGVVDGYLSPGQTTARKALEPLLELFGAQISEEQGTIKITQPSYSDRLVLSRDNLLQENELPKEIKRRTPELELPAEAVLTHSSLFKEYEQAAAKSRRLSGGSDRQIQMQVPVVISEHTAVLIAEDRLRDAWSMRDHISASLSSKQLAISAGDIISFSETGTEKWLVEDVEIGVEQQLKLRSISDRIHGLAIPTPQNGNISPFIQFGQPVAYLLDLPALADGDVNSAVVYCAVSAEPWAKSYNVFSSPDTNAFQLRDTITQRSIIGRLLNSIGGGPVGRLDHATNLHVELNSGAFQSRSLVNVLAGTNVLALKSNNGGYEILQFQSAELLQDGAWAISGLLRGQLGTDSECDAGADTGAQVVLLDEALMPIPLQNSEIGISKNWRIGPSADPVSTTTYAAIKHVPAGRAKQMFSPVHLRVRLQSDVGLVCSWIRRGRSDSDRWDIRDIPLDASRERYRITIKDQDNHTIKEVETERPDFIYSNAEIASDLGAEPSQFDIFVSQLNNAGDAGPSAKHSIIL